MDVRIDPSWKEALAAEWDKPYFKALTDFVRQQYATQTVYPPAGRIFAAFDACPFDDVRVVILGQDPYHGPGQANGLSFSVNPGSTYPARSRTSIASCATTSASPSPSGDLSRWARQGVLLLNATLTVEAGRAGSHQGHGWEELTDAAIRELATRREGLVFILWGHTPSAREPS